MKRPEWKGGSWNKDQTLWTADKEDEVEEADINLGASFAAQEVELKRTMKHLQDKSFLETMALLISWMGTNQAKRMNDFWDERGGI